MPDDPAASHDGEATEPEQIREQIAETRERLGETVEALAYKVDVKSRARESTSAARQAAADRLRALSQRGREELSGVRGRLGDREELRRRVADAGGAARQRLAGRAQWPGAKVAGGIGAGLLSVLLVLRRRRRRG